jgi:hypothetical protein
MQLTVDGQMREFIPIQAFRQKYSLPSDFGVSTFYHKNFEGKGSIQGAGAALNELRQATLQAIPEDKPPQNGWLTFSLELQLHFHRKLVEINPKVGLHQSEIEYAVAGFGDVCQAYIQAAMSARMRGKRMREFDEVYQQWLDSVVFTAKEPFPYTRQGQEWQVRLIQYVYGLTGMIVQTEDETYYVFDNRLACPAEAFMTALLSEVCAKIRKQLIPPEMGTIGQGA